MRPPWIARPTRHIALGLAVGLGLVAGAVAHAPARGADRPPRLDGTAAGPARLFLPLGLRLVSAGPAPADRTADLFDTRRLLDLRIELAPEDWDALRLQARTMADIFGREPCLTAPPVSPFTYFPAEVRVDGQLVGRVGVRKKGLLGSMSSTKPSLKIKFDEYVPRQRLRGMDLMTLNNAQQDPSYLRQCVTYGLFARAGLPAPRCGFARVTVNGQDLGVYVHVESIAKPFLARHFADAGGNLYEGTLSDFRPEWLGTFERKTNTVDANRSDLAALATVLESSDDRLLPELERVLDLDAYLDFWAMEVLTGHWDGYASNRNNFYVYHDPSDGRFRFIPWGTDATLQANFPPPPGGGPAPAAVVATARLPRRLYQHPVGRQRYLNHLTALLDEVWDERVILAEIDRLAVLIRPALAPELVADFDREVEAVRAYVRGRRAAIVGELAAGPVPWDRPESGPPCRRAVGHFRSDFVVGWARPGVITATARVELLGTPLDLAQVGAAAGLSGADPWPGHPAIQVAGIALAETPPIWRPGDALVVIVYVDPRRFGPDRAIAIDGQDAFAWVVLAPLNPDGTRRFVLLGFLWDGTLTLRGAGTQPGDEVSGTIDADIVVFGG